MIVNLYVDHMLSTPPSSAEEVWNATREHSRLFTDAAARIGLTPGEYTEFRKSLLDGKAVYVRLPRRLDAMSGDRRGSVYAVHNAVMTTPVMGWRVALANGAQVYVPQACGNLSLLRPPVVAHAPKARPLAPIAKRAKLNEAIATVPKEVPVIATAPDAVAAPVVPIVAMAPVAAAPVIAAAPRGLFFLIPAILGGAIAGISHGGGGSSPSVPACSFGSNASGVCSK